jgi:methyltransferase
MGLSVVAYLALLAVVGLLRLVEIGISKRNQRWLISQGVEKVSEPRFRWMVLFHAGILVSAGLEVVLLHRPFLPALGLAMGAVFVLANGVRWWVIGTLARHWNVGVMASVQLGVVTSGPYRWVRHPNYLAVFLELLALPLIHTAWLTALVGSMFHVAILRQRVRVEESTLLANPAYREAMGSKPRFLPKLF